MEHFYIVCGTEAENQFNRPTKYFFGRYSDYSEAYRCFVMVQSGNYDQVLFENNSVKQIVIELNAVDENDVVQNNWNRCCVKRPKKFIPSTPCLSLPTPLGLLCAEVGGDPDYPEIFTYLRKDNGEEIDLVAVTVDKEKENIRALLWKDTNNDDYTDSHLWTKAELERGKD